MTDRDYERSERRRQQHRKSVISSVIACVVIVAAVAAIVIVVLSLINKNTPESTADPTAVVTEQPTLYRPTEKSTEVKATQQSGQQATQAYGQTATQGSVQTEAASPTEAQTAETEAPPKPTFSPEAVAGALHFKANGKTSYGYNWTYSGGVGVNINCTYDFSNQEYDFAITGVTPGTTSFTLIYYTDDNETVSVPMSVSVDSDLKVTRLS